MKGWFIVAVALVLLAVAPARAEIGQWKRVADNVARTVVAAEESFNRGDLGGAKRLLTEAYFSHFEGGELEAAIRGGRGSRRALEVETMFSRVRSAMGAGNGRRVADLVAELNIAVRFEADALDTANYRLPPPVAD